jgi:hypothetical protein
MKTLLFEQVVERGFRALQLVRVLGHVGAGLRLEMIAEIRLVFFPYFLRGRFLAMLRVTHVVLDTQFAHVQLGAAFLARIETTQW